jgi:hypothetical protein
MHSRLVDVPLAGAAITVQACREEGTGLAQAFSNSLNATLVGTGTGAQVIRPAPRNGTR